MQLKLRNITRSENTGPAGNFIQVVKEVAKVTRGLREALEAVHAGVIDIPDRYAGHTDALVKALRSHGVVVEGYEAPASAGPHHAFLLLRQTALAGPVFAGFLSNMTEQEIVEARGTGLVVLRLESDSEIPAMTAEVQPEQL